eukprot:TRINITY_DN37100_c0_g1_i1.p1 TRINITY_DN37100_c0_g1~~TRINITY_DN37100_c0_g1_i1.p1  ORF type:complete len:576 (-),score=110.48 TRINITY_DN37100_c0_g1_i1:63-1790(-)
MDITDTNELRSIVESYREVTGSFVIGNELKHSPRHHEIHVDTVEEEDENEGHAVADSDDELTLEEKEARERVWKEKQRLKGESNFQQRFVHRVPPAKDPPRPPKPPGKSQGKMVVGPPPTTAAAVAGAFVPHPPRMERTGPHPPPQRSLLTALFQKEAVQSDRHPRKSSLTQEVASIRVLPRAATLSVPPSTRLPPPSPGISAGTTTILLTMYLPIGAGELSVMGLRVPEDYTIEQTIGATLRQAACENREPYLGMNPSHFELRVADEAGLVNESITPLDPNRTIKSVGDSKFALRTLPEGERTQPKRSASGGLGTIFTGDIPDFLRQKSTDRQLFVKVYLPDNQSMIVRTRPEMKLTDVVTVVAQKRLKDVKNLAPDRCVLKLKDEDRLKLGYESDVLDMSRTLGSIPVNEFIWGEKVFADRPGNRFLRRISGADPGRVTTERPLVNFDKEPVDLDTFVFSEVTAGQYTEYDVIKVNRKGKAQDRVLAIDRDKLYNLKRQGSLGKALGQPTKRPSWSVKNVKEVRIHEERPTCFQIIYKDDAGGVTHPYDYECKSAHCAAEIVAKIRFLATLKH